MSEKIKFVYIRCVLLGSNAQKFVFDRGSAPDTAGGAHDAPPDAPHFSPTRRFPPMRTENRRLGEEFQPPAKYRQQTSHPLCADTGKARLPTVDILTEATTRWLVSTERRDRRPGRSATRMKGPNVVALTNKLLVIYNDDDDAD